MTCGLTNDFRTDDGPDLHVLLSPTGAAKAESENTMAGGGAVVLGSLEALSGAQMFDVPDTLRLDRYRSSLIHCVKFTHLYGAAPVKRR